MKIIKMILASGVLFSHGLFGQLPPEPVYLPPPHSSSAQPQNNLPYPAKKVSKGNEKFAFELYTTVAKEKGARIAFSPFSVSSCLAMVAMAAEGEPLKQIQEVLHFPEYPLILDFGFRWINESMKTGMAIGSEPVHLLLTNTIWTQEGVIVSPTLLTKIAHFWDGGVQSADFKNNPETARETLNAYIAEKTLGEIKDLIPPGTLDSKTVLAVVNTLYLKAPWKTPFNLEKTHQDLFQAENGTESIVPFMYQQQVMNLGHQPNFRLLEIPFADPLSNASELSLFILLPNSVTDLEKIEETLTAKQFRNWVKTMEPRGVKLHLPRFSTESFLRLKPILQAMGLTLPFSEEGGFPYAEGEQKVVLTDVIQMVKVDFNEWGTTCSAGTAATLGTTNYHDTENYEEFLCNHPFIYLIIDKTTRSILFIGKLTELPSTIP